MTVQYSKDRMAFGRPIGSYQALKHRMADHRMWLEGSFATTAYAARAVQAEPRRTPRLAARMAKAHVGKWSSAILHDCIQLHGGIAMTWELRPPSVFPPGHQQRGALRIAERTAPGPRRHRGGGSVMTADGSTIGLEEFRARVRAWLAEHVPRKQPGERFLQWDDEGVARYRSRSSGPCGRAGSPASPCPSSTADSASAGSISRSSARRGPTTGCRRSSATRSTWCCRPAGARHART